jgi:hypothetical protein
MEVVVWIAFAIIVTAGGPGIMNSGEMYETKAACEASNAKALEVWKADPAFEQVGALGMACAEIKVTDVDHKKAAKPSAKGQKQRDLESSRDPAHASPFRSL